MFKNNPMKNQTINKEKKCKLCGKVLIKTNPKQNNMVFCNNKCKDKFKHLKDTINGGIYQ